MIKALITYRDNDSFRYYVPNVLFPTLKQLGIKFFDRIIAPQGERVSETLAQKVSDALSSKKYNVIFYDRIMKDAAKDEAFEGFPEDRKFAIDNLINPSDCSIAGVFRKASQYISVKECFIIEEHLFDHGYPDSKIQEKICNENWDETCALAVKEEVQKALQGVKTTIVKKVGDLPFDYDNPPSGMLVIVDRHVTPGYDGDGEYVESSTKNFFENESFLFNDTICSMRVLLQKIILEHSKELIAAREKKLQEDLTKFHESQLINYFLL